MCKEDCFRQMYQGPRFGEWTEVTIDVCCNRGCVTLGCPTLGHLLVGYLAQYMLVFVCTCALVCAHAQTSVQLPAQPNGQSYKIDMNAMHQTNLSTGFQRAVRRRYAQPCVLSRP